MPRRSPRSQTRYKPWDGDIQHLEPLGNGISGMTWAIDEETVAKVHIGSERSMDSIETERRAYRILGNSHPYILKCFETDNPSGLVLERCHTSLRQRVQLRRKESISPDEVLHWAYQAAKGLAYIHHCGIIHGDVGCHNILLSSSGTLKIADFAGSSVDGSSATVDYEVWSRLPGVDEPDEISDLFALGSAIYEMATGRPPYHGLQPKQIVAHYKKGQFPDLGSILPSSTTGRRLAAVIKKCWKQLYPRAQDIVDYLEPYVCNVNPEDQESDVSLRDAENYPTASSYNRAARRQRHAHSQTHWEQDATPAREKKKVRGISISRNQAGPVPLIIRLTHPGRFGNRKSITVQG